MKRTLAFLLLMLLMVSSQSSAYAQSAGEPIDIGPGMALGANDRDMVVGVTPDTFNPRSGWIWQHGERRELGTLGGDWSLPRDVNRRGDVVGASATTDGTRHAFLWRNGHMVDLGTLGGAASEALAVNGRGEVVGWSQDAGGNRRAFHWRNGRMTDLGTLGGTTSTANDINRFGEIVGTARTVDGRENAVLWDREHQTIDLGEYLVPDPERRAFATITAEAINDAGQIVGTVYDEVGAAYRLDGLDPAKHVSLAPVGYFATPAAINNAGTTVGCGADEFDGCHAAVWDTDGQAVVLPGLQPMHAPGGSAAHDVNNSGLVVGWAQSGSWDDVEFRAVLWHAP